MLIFFIVCTALKSPLYAQDSIACKEQLVSDLFNKLMNESSDEMKLKHNSQICQLMRQLLQHRSSFDYPFELLHYMGKKRSPDGSFRLYNWNTVMADGSYRYFAFIQRKEGITDSTCQVNELVDAQGEGGTSVNKSVGANQWMGALYYQIVPFKSGRNDYYLLLGWDGHNALSNRKVIEILHFSSRGKPLLGAPLILWRGRPLHRVVFEYAKMARMTLRWEPSQQRVVFDHLSPSESRYKGLLEYYGPDLSFDALIKKGGMWRLAEDVDLRNKN